MFVKEIVSERATESKPVVKAAQKKVRANKMDYISKEEFERRFMDVGKQYEPVPVEKEESAGSEENKGEEKDQSEDSDAGFIVQNVESSRSSERADEESSV